MTPHSTGSRPSDPDRLDPDLLDRYWLWETSPEETTRIQEWLNASPGRRQRYDLLRRELKAGNWVDLSSDDVSRMMARVAGSDPQTQRPGKVTVGEPLPAKDTFQTGTLPPGRSVGKSRFPLQARYIAAACIVGVIAIFAGSGRDMVRPGAELAQQKSIYTTPQGQRAVVTLADGTTVMLNVGSQLEVPNDYGVTTRALRLRGEALFSVKQSHGIPLTVTAGPSTARVLGTQFTVRHYDTDTMATISVRDGKVGVQSAVLTAHQEIGVGHNGLTAIRNATADRFSFASGELIFSGRSLRDAIPDLNRWYDVDIQFGNPELGARQLSWKSTGGSLSDLTSILELALDVHVVREGRTITLYRR